MAGGEMVKPASGQQTRLFMRPYGMARRRDPHDSVPYRPLTTLQNRVLTGCVNRQSSLPSPVVTASKARHEAACIALADGV